MWETPRAWPSDRIVSSLSPCSATKPSSFSVNAARLKRPMCAVATLQPYWQLELIWGRTIDEFQPRPTDSMMIPSRCTSAGRVSAVDDVLRTGDVGRRVTCQEQDEAGDLASFSHSAQRNDVGQ